MGLADRFQEKLENKDIFQKNEIDKTLETNNIRFISKPIEKFKPECNILQEPVQEIEAQQTTPKLEDLETEIISKIRKTPYWDEYSTNRQKNMISKYFEIKKSKYTTENITISEKQEFISNILALANNR